MHPGHYLFADIETTGFPLNRNAPISDLNNWPRIVQLGWGLYSSTGKCIQEVGYIIKPEGFQIPISASRIHGITTEIAVRNGVSISSVLPEFVEILETPDVILVCHNLDFDRPIIAAELYRYGLQNKLLQLPGICTMKSSTQYCRIPSLSGYGYKWPSLQELHRTLFGVNYEFAHDALADVRACAKCFFELKGEKIL